MRKIFCVIMSLMLLVPANFAYAVSVSAKSAVLIDFYSGRILYEKNAYSRLPMASTTKIMTALCAIENGNLAETVTVDKRAVGVEGSSMYLGYNEKITLENLVYGLMLSSGNDAAVAIAIHISGSVEAFADLMNKTAKKIGANNTSFKNPNGLDDENHFTTAYDLAMITRYAMNNESFCSIVSSKEKKMPWDDRNYGRTLRNHNKLLFLLDYCDGVKTGFTKRSGRCLVSSANKDGLRVIAVTLSAPDDWNDHKNMLRYAIDNYKAVCVAEKGGYAMSANVDNSEKDSVKCVFADDIFITVKKDENLNVTYESTPQITLPAPVNYGDKVCSLNINANGLNITANLISADSADKNKSIKEKMCEKEFSKNFLTLFKTWITAKA